MPWIELVRMYVAAPCLGAGLLAFYLARMPRFAPHKALLRPLAQAFLFGFLAIKETGEVARPQGTFYLVVDGLLFAFFLLLTVYDATEVREQLRAVEGSRPNDLANRVATDRPRRGYRRGGGGVRAQQKSALLAAP